MEVMEIAVLAAAVTFIVLSIFLIRTLNEVKRSAASVRKYVEDVEVSLQPVLRDMKEVTANMREMTEQIASRSDDIACLMTAIGDTGRNISKVNAVADNITNVICTSSLWMTGLKAAGRYAITRIAKKRG